MIEISFDKIKKMHRILAAETGGPVAMKNESSLAEALEGKFKTVGGQELYPTVEEKAAILGYSLIIKHPFFDGNMRLGMLAMLTLLEVNGIKIACTDEDIIKAGRSVAAGRMDYRQLLHWVLHHKD